MDFLFKYSLPYGFLGREVSLVMSLPGGQINVLFPRPKSGASAAAAGDSTWDPTELFLSLPSPGQDPGGTLAGSILGDRG